MAKNKLFGLFQRYAEVSKAELPNLLKSALLHVPLVYIQTLKIQCVRTLVHQTTGAGCNKLIKGTVHH